MAEQRLKCPVPPIIGCWFVVLFTADFPNMTFELICHEPLLYSELGVFNFAACIFSLLSLGKFHYVDWKTWGIVIGVGVCAGMVWLLELIFHGQCAQRFVFSLYILTLTVVVFRAFIRWYGTQVLLWSYRIISIGAGMILLLVLAENPVALIRLIDPREIKLLTDYGFVNRFGYTCSFGVLLLGIIFAMDKACRPSTLDVILALAPVAYLFVAKSKGAISVLGLGGMGFCFFYVNARTRMLFYSLCFVGLYFKQSWSDLFVRFMLLGRSVPMDIVGERITMMFTNRFGAALVSNNPQLFFQQTPFGIGSVNALERFHHVPGKDVVMGNHSLLLILTDAYGVAGLGIMGILVVGVILHGNAATRSALIMLSIPFVFVNFINWAYAIPLVLIITRELKGQGMPWMGAGAV